MFFLRSEFSLHCSQPGADLGEEADAPSSGVRPPADPKGDRLNFSRVAFAENFVKIGSL